MIRVATFSLILCVSSSLYCVGGLPRGKVDGHRSPFNVQVPFYLSSQQDYRRNRSFFPERNKTMSVLSEATVIVEASESSGSLTQAEAAIQQRRKLFILRSCFERGLDWTEKFLKQGAIRVVDGSEILEHLGSTVHGSP